MATLKRSSARLGRMSDCRENAAAHGSRSGTSFSSGAPQYTQETVLLQTRRCNWLQRIYSGHLVQTPITIGELGKTASIHLQASCHTPGHLLFVRRKVFPHFLLLNHAHINFMSGAASSMSRKHARQSCGISRQMDLRRRCCGSSFVSP